jgi:hypothetical protein
MSPKARPNPTVMTEKTNVTQRLWWKSDDVSTSRYWSRPTYEVPPKGSDRKKPSQNVFPKG